MELLKLPEFNIRIRDTEIFCLIRKKWVYLTPEEWVRQHFLNLLIHHFDYPKGLMRLEHTLVYFKNSKRSDIMVLNRYARIFLLVECKAPSVCLDHKVVNQLSEYNKVLSSKYVAVSNGLKHFVWEKKDNEYMQLEEFPRYY
ncbi:MAG: type I restriction enzyme HsdR N-terminal domain-containing protein [Bacteroidota bacterium]